MTSPVKQIPLVGEIPINMKTEKDDSNRVETSGAPPPLMATDCDWALADILIAEKVVTRPVVNPLLQRLPTERAAAVQNGQPLTLLQLLVTAQIAKLDDLLAIIVERSGLPYLPLATYDVDRNIACLLPRGIAFEFCLIPFDQISRSVLVTAANPLNPVTCNQIRELIDYDLFWYVSSPVEITNALRRAHGLDKPAASDRAKA